MFLPTIFVVFLLTFQFKIAKNILLRLFTLDFTEQISRIAWAKKNVFLKKIPATSLGGISF